MDIIYIALAVLLVFTTVSLLAFIFFTTWRITVELAQLRDLKRRLKQRPSARAMAPDGRLVHERDP
jgi:hypothetical protein